MDNIVCLDTHILIWGIKEQASPGQEDMIPRAKAFLKHLEDKNFQILVPALVLSELLFGLPPESYTTVNNLINKSFMVASFDAQAAVHLARIWKDKENQGIIQKLKQDNGATKSKLRVDCQIVAIAVAQQASCIYTNDRSLRAFAQDYIEAKEMPDILTQAEMEFSQLTKTIDPPHNP